MARGQSRTTRQGQRDVTTTRRYRSPVLSLDVPLYRPSSRYEYPSLTDIEDRRRYGFSVLTPPRTLTVGPVRTVVKRSVSNPDRFARFRPRPVTFSSPLPHRVAFEAPHRLALCHRRKTRREVIHALKLTGKGAGARRRRHNEWSQVSC